MPDLLSDRRAVIHIGVEKTGTTYLQAALHASSDVLSRAGWSYPTFLGAANHHALAAFAVDPVYDQDIHRWHGVTPDNVGETRERFADRFCTQTAAGSRWIFSSEHLSSRATLKDAQVLAALLDRAGLRPTIVFYVRRQDSMIPSSFSTAVKAGSPKPFDLSREIGAVHRYDFAALFDRWHRVFPGNVVVRPFWEGRPPGWLVADFCNTVLDLGPSLSGNLAIPPTAANASLSPAFLEMLRHLNAAAAEDDAPAVDRGRLVSLLEERSTGATFRLSRAQRSRVMRRFRESNLRLCDQVEDDQLAALLLSEESVESPPGTTGAPGRIATEDVAFFIQALTRSLVRPGA